MKGYKISTVLLAILSVVLFFSTVYYYNNQQIEYRTVENTDTIFVHTVDTVKVNNSEIIYRDVHILDTIYIKDTAMLFEQKVFEDSISTIYISGVNPELDSIEYRIPRDTLIVSKEIIQTVKEKDNFFKNRFMIAAGAFAGYGLINKQPDVFLGIGCAIRLY